MKKKQKKEMFNECLSDKGTAKLYIQLFRFKKKNRSEHLSTRSISEILKPFKKSADMYNQNLEIHSCWSFKQYLKFDYRMRHIHYYFKSKMFISPKMFKIFTKYRSHSTGKKCMSLLHR